MHRHNEGMPSSRLRVIPTVALALVLATLAWAIGVARPPAPDRPPRNLVLISLDTLRADHLGAWGYGRATSPRIDALAEESVVFSRAVAQGSSTIPSHASLFTGQYPSSVIGLGAGLLDGPETLAEALSRAGFATWGFVDGGNVRAHFGFARGFDHYEDDRVGIERLTARARRWIEDHPTPRFFLFLHTYDIHTPYKAPSEYVAEFGDPDYRGGFRPNAKYFRKVERSGKGLEPREHHEVVARYDAGILYTDERVGAFLDWLAERGLLEDSLVVITSDHGEEFLEHGRLGHQQLHLDPNLRVPLLFRGAGLRPRVIEDTVELTDVVPTVLELLGVPPLREAVGRSLSPYWTAGHRPARGAYAEKGTTPGQQTLITDRYQLLEDRRTKEVVLYDLQTDPGARKDVSAERPEVAARLAAELSARREDAAERFRSRRVADRPAAPPMKEKVRRELEALGYLEPSS